MFTLDSCERAAESLIETARHRPEKLLTPGSSPVKWKSLHQKLLELYLEESKKEQPEENLVSTSKLLEKLVKRDGLNTLVANLYPGDEGFSIGLRGKGSTEATETIRLPYEESDFLEHVDNEELPSMLVDLIDRAQTNVFYSGCVICELRDYRRAINTCDVTYVLLRPTQQSLLNDITTLTCDGHRWTQEDKDTLESQLLLATAEPLCLDPSPTAFYVTSKLTQEKHLLNTPAVKRNAKRYSQVALNRKRRMMAAPPPSSLKLHDFLCSRKDKARSVPPVNLKVAKTCVDMWRQREVPLTTPATIDVEKYARPLEKTTPIRDNTPIVVEEYTFETGRGHGKINFSRLTVMQRLSDESFIGKLYVDRDYVEGRSEGSTCKFPLGTRADVIKYINQFREIFTEEGRRQVKITHCVPGQNPSVTFTQTIHGSSHSQQGSNQSQPSASQQAATAVQQGQGQMAPIQGQANTASFSVGSGPQIAQQALLQAASLNATLTGQLSLPGTGADGAKKLPIKLSLSINPQGAITTNQNTAQALPTGQLNNAASQLTPHQIASQKLRQMGVLSGQLRSSSAPSTPNQQVSTPSATISIPNFSGTLPSNPTLTLTSSSGPTLQITPQSGFAKPAHVVTQPATPPPNVTITMATSIPMLRRASNTDTTARGGGHTSVSTSASTAPTSADPSGTANQILASISTSSAIGQSLNVTSQSQSSSVPQNINIQSLTGLQGVNITSLQAVQNIQVSVSGQSISVPLPLGVISGVNQNVNQLNVNQNVNPLNVNQPAANQSVNQLNVKPLNISQNLSHLNVNSTNVNQNVNQLNLSHMNVNQNVNQINVNQLNVGQNLTQLNMGPNVTLGSVNQTGSAVSSANQQQTLQATLNQSNRIQTEQLLGAGDAPLSGVMTTTSNTPSQAQSPVLSQLQAPSGSSVMGGGQPSMLSLPIGVAGNITQFMAGVGLKGAQGIRPGTPYLISQVPGQQPVPILGAGSGFSQGSRIQLSGSPATTPIKHHPESPSGSTGLLSPPSVPAQSPQHVSPFSPLRQGSAGQAMTSPQFVQLAPQSSVTHLTIQGGSATPTKPKKRPSQCMSPRL